ncbi:PDR/VanB family oxidoreductase [Nocardia cyriacigeorgica]|uniref:PDR/VanB family oxidoreductase n=2 Tax=Nocardia cyriacigeorgica TaxID=135487 RepID=UPI001892F7D6|nr:PDR/VanB family oxidoreductase [Nocardia cyriacigeorgica]MBF6435312.1 oxidoreductase [Nocardia cyriacigeorgica]
MGFRTADFPSSLHRPGRPDRLMRFLSVGLNGLMFAEKFAHLPPVPSVDHVDFHEVTVIGREIVALDENVVALTFAGTEPLGRWSAGAHLDVKLPSGAVRQYSLCGDAGDHSTYRIAVRLIPDGRGGSAEVHSLAVGDRIEVSKPRNAFPLALGGYNQAHPAVRFIAGGIGITPILPMLAAADKLGVEWTMIYAGRSRESLAFLDELAPYGDRITLHVDDEQGLAGAEELLGPLVPGAAVYTCGPAPMLDSLSAALAEHPTVEFHFERFSEAPVVDGKPFELRLARTGERITVDADTTALTALLEKRPDATYSCRQGFCRSCAVRVLDGAPEHRSAALSKAEEEEGYFLPCVSRAEGTLTLDL